MRTLSSRTVAANNRRRSRGFTVAEFTLAGFVMLLSLLGVLSISSVALIASDKNATESALTGGSRVAMDEALLHLRGATQVLSSQVLGTTTYTTGASQIVVQEPAYDPASSKFYLDSVTDCVVLRYDTTRKCLLETIVPGIGSVRPLRRDHVLASNITSCTFTYRAREFFKSSATGNTKFNLLGSPSGTPSCFVNGTQTSCSFNASNNSVQVQLSSKDNDVQFVYTVSPSSSSSALALVGQVDITLKSSSADSRQVVRNMTLEGSARLRNSRK